MTFRRRRRHRRHRQRTEAFVIDENLRLVSDLHIWVPSPKYPFSATKKRRLYVAA